ncbi:hypothetical protein HC028_21160 [Planosporangium flavigriseum]|uniref:hypothetical protein n=1 Tax=Planosporangium flavigriseum TaxID=373681 RepID=UPI00143A31F0|nr:hypothetical protein [Planosporangium flavigriseum]NJC66993.1 hypothetical protein [Planosporangium flavigriseum]
MDDDDDHSAERSRRRRLTVSLASMASEADIMEAGRLLNVHRPRTVVRRACTGCGLAWPCLDTVYAWAVTGTKPEPPPTSGGH